MKPRPIKDRIIVKPDATPEPSEGLYIPQEQPPTGIAVAVGKKTDEVIVGDRVRYGKHSGIEINIEGEDYLIMREDEILLIL